MVGRRQGVKWPNRIHSRVDAYPLVGLAVTFLVIFMVGPPIVTPGSVVDLPDKIRERLKDGAEKKVYIRADARARYIDVKQVLIEIRQAGIENVCFFAEKIKQ